MYEDAKERERTQRELCRALDVPVQFVVPGLKPTLRDRIHFGSMRRRDNAKRRLARRMHFMADRIDNPGAFKKTSMSFYYKSGFGVVVDMDGRRGCPLWYHGDADYDRAHDEGE